MVGKSFLVDFVVVAVLRVQSILGLDFLESHQCMVNTGQKKHFTSRALQCQCKQQPAAQCIGGPA